MRVGNKDVPKRVRLFLAVASLIAVVLMALNCSDHRFTPIAEVNIYPNVVDYDLQRSAQYEKSVVITNRSVSAKLDIYEIDFADASDLALTDDRADEEKADGVVDQAIDLADLQAKEANSEDLIEYEEFPGGISSNVSCTVDEDCNCVAQDGGFCTTTVTDADGNEMNVKQQKMGSLFKCTANPFNPSATKSFCVAHYRYLNNAGPVHKSFWGGRSDNACTDSNDCTRYGAEYSCETGKCVSDIRFSFAVEYELQRLVNVKPDTVESQDNAAIWRAAEYAGEGSGLCLVDADGKVLDEPVELYGLNRCDQIALKQGIGSSDIANPLRMKNIDDGDSVEDGSKGYSLYPKAQANYRLMVSDIDFGQAKFLAFCDNPSERITESNIVLIDPVGIEEDCYDDEGNFKEDLLSISPSEVKIDQLPIRLVYEPDEAYASSEVLTAKSVTMKISNSATLGDDEGLGNTVNITLQENLGGPPTPVIELTNEEPEPLDQIHLDGRNSTSPFGEKRKPFQYWWEWAPGGKPTHAQDVHLIKASGSIDNPASIMGEWSSEGFPKIKFPVGGEYKIRMKVRDIMGVESGPTAECPKCDVWAQADIKVRPKEKLHVELLWMRDKFVDFDIFLVRERPDGTFAVHSSYQDKIEADPPTMGPCDTDADCQGHFSCGPGGFCENTCTGDEQCKAINLGWICSDRNECDTQLGDVIECEADEDCGDLGHCNPAKVGSAGWKMICTDHDRDAVNDTCYFSNTNPRWGSYDELDIDCSGDLDCTGGVESLDFTCESGSCDYSCDYSSECLEASPEYICSPDSQCVGNNPDDDPTLDIDDVDGWGPENISLKEPQTGRYRIVARFFADPQQVVSNDTPNAPVQTYVQVFLNGEIALDHEISHEFHTPNTYWKVADIDWVKDDVNPEDSTGTIAPVCAGWTLTECSTSDECKDWFGDGYTCETRSWNKWCSSCLGTQLPADCDPRISCSSDSDCNSLGGGFTCTEIKGSFCKCGGSNEFANFDEDPYANPFWTSSSGSFIPGDPAIPRSIWCDDPSDKYNETDSCSTLYQ